MKVKEVIDQCAELLEVDSTKENLLECFHLVESDLAATYLPLYATHRCNSKVIYYTEFEYKPIRVVCCNCKFKIYPEYIEAKEVITEVKYAYMPNKKALYDDCSYGSEFLKCLAYGTIAEYLAWQGFYEEAVVWNQKYEKEIEILML